MQAGGRCCGARAGAERCLRWLSCAAPGPPRRVITPRRVDLPSLAVGSLVSRSQTALVALLFQGLRGRFGRSETTGVYVARLWGRGHTFPHFTRRPTHSYRPHRCRPLRAMNTDSPGPGFTTPYPTCSHFATMCSRILIANPLALKMVEPPLRLDERLRGMYTVQPVADSAPLRAECAAAAQTAADVGFPTYLIATRASEAWLRRAGALLGVFGLCSDDVP